MPSHSDFYVLTGKKEPLKLDINVIKEWAKKLNLTTGNLSSMTEIPTKETSKELRGILEDLEEFFREESLNEEIIKDPEFQSELLDIYNVLVENWSNKDFLSESQFLALYRLGRLVNAVQEDELVLITLAIKYIDFITEKILPSMSFDVNNPQHVLTLRTILKLVIMNLGVTFKGFSSVRMKVSEALSNELLMMSTILLTLTPQILLVPLIGTLDSDRASYLMNRILQTIEKNSFKIVILDITGVSTMDSGTARHMLETIRAIKLMGARTIITGMNVSIATTIVKLNVKMGDVVTKTSLYEGLMESIKMLRQEESLDVYIDKNNSATLMED